MAFAQSMLQQPLSRTFRGERKKPLATRGRLGLALACVGNVFAHRLFTHLIRPPEEEEGNIVKGRGQEKRRKAISGFHHTSVALSIETLKSEKFSPCSSSSRSAQHKRTSSNIIYKAISRAAVTMRLASSNCNRA